MDKEIIKRLVSFFVKPFKDNFGLFLFLWITSSICDIVFRSRYEPFYFCLYMAIHGYILCYFTVLLVGFFKGRAEEIFKKILIALGIINIIIDASCYISSGHCFDGSIVLLILGTNQGEATEFINAYFSWKLVAFVALSLLAAFIVKRLANKINKSFYLTTALCVLLITGLFVVIIKHSHNWEGVFLAKVDTIINTKDSSIDIPHQNIELNILEDQPKKVVLIIGEALSKRHCSLYGYGLKTTPKLDTLKENGDIITYTNVESPSTNTFPCFKIIMAAQSEKDSLKQWYEKPFLIEIMRAAGYNTSWISNQASVGLYGDNQISKIAKLTDEQIWTSGKYETNFDSEVLPYMKRDKYSQEFIIVHLKGQHEYFKLRYPPEYSVFTEDDYIQFPSKQRETRAHYDNAVLYGDYIISSIIDAFSEDEALVIFFPDHSLDIYDSDPEFAGHARVQDPYSVLVSEEIPFIIYPSPKYKDHFPQQIKEMEENSDSAYNTKDITTTLMRWLGLEFVK